MQAFLFPFILDILNINILKNCIMRRINPSQVRSTVFFNDSVDGAELSNTRYSL